jgi:hypothetical protein
MEWLFLWSFLSDRAENGKREGALGGVKVLVGSVAVHRCWGSLYEYIDQLSLACNNSSIVSSHVILPLFSDYEISAHCRVSYFGKCPEQLRRSLSSDREAVLAFSDKAKYFFQFQVYRHNHNCRKVCFNTSRSTFRQKGLLSNLAFGLQQCQRMTRVFNYGIPAPIDLRESQFPTTRSEKKFLKEPVPELGLADQWKGVKILGAG